MWRGKEGLALSELPDRQENKAVAVHQSYDNLAPYLFNRGSLTTYQTEPTKGNDMARTLLVTLLGIALIPPTVDLIQEVINLLYRCAGR